MKIGKGVNEKEHEEEAAQKNARCTEKVKYDTICRRPVSD